MFVTIISILLYTALSTKDVVNGFDVVFAAISAAEVYMLVCL